MAAVKAKAKQSLLVTLKTVIRRTSRSISHRCLYQKPAGGPRIPLAGRRAMGSKGFEQIAMDRAVGGDDLAAVDARLTAFEVADHGAGLAGDDDAGGDIPGR